MSFEGTIVNGTVVFDEPPDLPEGTRVAVVMQTPVESQPTLSGLLKFAGRIKEMPADFSAVTGDHHFEQAGFSALLK